MILWTVAITRARLDVLSQRSEVAISLSRRLRRKSLFASLARRGIEEDQQNRIASFRSRVQCFTLSDFARKIFARCSPYPRVKMASCHRRDISQLRTVACFERQLRP